MKITSIKRIPKKQLIVFDADGTLALTKSAMDEEMLDLVKQLLANKKVAVISGAKFEVMQMQIHLERIKKWGNLQKNLFLFPTTATTFYRYAKSWKKVYSLKLSKAVVKKIKSAFEQAFATIDYKHPKKVYGELIEDRGSQVSFSVYGQDIVQVLGKRGVKMKELWRDKYTPIKLKIAKIVSKLLPELEVRAAGFTTIDVTNKGIDKAYGLEKMREYLKVPIKDMLFVGDAIFPGGNDYAVVKTGVDYVAVKSPDDTKKVIRQVLKK